MFDEFQEIWNSQIDEWTTCTTQVRKIIKVIPTYDEHEARTDANQNAQQYIRDAERVTSILTQQLRQARTLQSQQREQYRQKIKLMKQELETLKNNFRKAQFAQRSGRHVCTQHVQYSTVQYTYVYACVGCV